MRTKVLEADAFVGTPEINLSKLLSSCSDRNQMGLDVSACRRINCADISVKADRSYVRTLVCLKNFVDRSKRNAGYDFLINFLYVAILARLTDKRAANGSHLTPRG